MKKKSIAHSESILAKRWRRFTSLKRGYYSFIILIILYLVSFFSPLLLNNKPLLASYEGKIIAPALGDLGYPYFKLLSNFHSAESFGMQGLQEVNYRELKKKFAQENKKGNWIIMPLYPFHPNENLLGEISRDPPTKPDHTHWLGTDNRGRDILCRMVYGFNISLTFSLFITGIGYVIGMIIGALQGFYAGRFDIYFQRFIEIVASLPFLYIIMIAVSIMQPSFYLLAILMVLLSTWIGISYYIRSEFYREKAKDYVGAAISMGSSDARVMFRHILPNALTPVITFAPFSIISGIYSLVALDYLGFGLAPPTPSWGELARQGVEELRYWWLIVSPLTGIFCTLLLISFIGEGVREAFDPKAYSRLR